MERTRTIPHVEEGGKAKVGEADIEVSCEEDVLALDIPVRYRVGVEVVEGGRYLTSPDLASHHVDSPLSIDEVEEVSFLS